MLILIVHSWATPEEAQPSNRETREALPYIIRHKDPTRTAMAQGLVRLQAREIQSPEWWGERALRLYFWSSRRVF
jgi:hypothetical protein